MPPPGGGWGRKAGAGSEKRLQDDTLFKEIGGQLQEANFDYDRFERTKKTSQQTRQASSVLTTDRQPIASKQVKTPVVLARPCAHSKHKIQKEKPADLSKALARAEGLKILQLRIKSRRKTIEEYKKRQMELIDENTGLRVSIDAMEQEAHNTVKTMLRKYERFRAGISTLNNKFDGDLVFAKADLVRTKKEVDQGLAEVQKQVDEVNGRLKLEQKELHILQNYKHQEYPVKSLQISELQKEIEQISLKNEVDELDLQQIADLEIDKLHQQNENVHTNITETATEEALNKIDPNLQEKAIQNTVMMKEIAFHNDQILELQEENLRLENEVREMRRSPKSNIRKQMFPELFRTVEKCTPDMDVVLDIPKREWLPI